MAIMDVLSFYEAVLKAAGVSITEDKCLDIDTGDEKIPLTIKSKRVVLPYENQLRIADWSQRVAFHPLKESLVGGESEVLARFRLCVTSHLNILFADILQELLVIGSSPAQHSQLNPSQSEFLTVVKDIDEKTVVALQNIIKKTPTNRISKSFVDMFIRKGGVLEGKTYDCVGIVSFPLYEELKESDKEIWGVKLRVKDRTAIMSLMEYMIPGIGEQNRYSYPTMSRKAPRTECLLWTFANVLSPLANLVTLFNGVFTKEYAVNMDWIETLENIGELDKELRSMPMLSGNEASRSKVEEAEQRVQENAAVGRAVERVAPPLRTLGDPAPAQAAETTSAVAATVASNGRKNYSDFLRQPEIRERLSNNRAWANERSFGGLPVDNRNFGRREPQSYMAATEVRRQIRNGGGGGNFGRGGGNFGRGGGGSGGYNM